MNYKSFFTFSILSTAALIILIVPQFILRYMDLEYPSSIVLFTTCTILLSFLYTYYGVKNKRLTLDKRSYDYNSTITFFSIIIIYSVVLFVLIIGSFQKFTTAIDVSSIVLLLFNIKLFNHLTYRDLDS